MLVTYLLSYIFFILLLNNSKFIIYGSVEAINELEAQGTVLYHHSSYLIPNMYFGVSVEGEREITEDGAFPAHEHFPQAGD